MGRISIGFVLIVSAVLFGYLQIQRASGQVDRDFAACQYASPDCESQNRPVTVFEIGPGATGQREFELAVQIGPHSTFSFYGLTERDVAQLHLTRSSTVPVFYRHGRAVAIAAPDGSAVPVPFSMLKTMLWVVIISGATGLLGVGVTISGLFGAARLKPAY
jgi:hypothetical protein